MTEPRQDLPNDPQLSRLYRDHAQDEPSVASDQRILAAARQAVAARPPPPRRTGWWQRWRMPLTLLTTVMLTATLALLVERQPKDLSGLPRGETARRDSAQEGTAESDRQQQAPATPPPRAKAAPLPSHEAADLATTPPSPAAKAESRSAPAGAAGESGTATNRAEPRAEPHGALRGEMQAAPAPAIAPPQAAPLAKSRADSARAPERWLEEIRTLRRAGQLEEAERQLREFRLANPDYPLPEEFRQ